MGMLTNTKFNISKKIDTPIFFSVIFYLIFFGIFFRFSGLVHPMSFFCDEGGLIHNVRVKNYLDLFLPLNQNQCCPPIFMVLSKIVYSFSGIDEFWLRILPFCSSAASLLLFSFLVLKLFKNKISVIFAITLFAFNLKLINFSYIFKHYSTDCLFSILILMFALHVKNIEPTVKNSIFAAFFFLICVFSSYTSLLIILPFLFIYLIKLYKKNLFREKRTQILKALSTFCLCFFPITGLYFLKNCVPNIENDFFQLFWGKYVMFYPKDIASIKDFFIFLSGVPKYCFPAIFFLSEIATYLLFKKNKFLFLLLTLPFAFSLLLGLLAIYPFCAERTCLFLIPLFIIFVSYPFETDFAKNSVIKITTITTGIILFAAQICYCLSYNESKLTEEYTISNIRQQYELLEKSDITKDDYIFPNYYNRDLFIEYDRQKKYDSSKLIQKFTKGELIDFFPDKSNIYFFLSDKYVLYSKDIEKTVRENCKIIYEADGYYGNFIKCYYEKKDK